METEELTQSLTSGMVSKDTFGKRLISSLAWQYVLTGTTAVLQVVVIAILSRLITKEDFGLLGMMLVFSGFAQLFSQFGVGHAIIQRDELNEIHIRVGFTLSVTLGIVIMAVFWLLAPAVATFYREPQITGIMRAISVLFIFEGLATVAQSLMRRELKFRELAFASLVPYVVGHVGVSVTMAIAGFGVWALVGGLLAQTALRAGFMFWVQPHPKRPLLRLDEARGLLRYGGGVTLGSLFNYGASQGDYLIVGRLMGAGALGVYTRAYQLMAMPATNLAVGLQAVIFPGMSQMKAEPLQLRRLYFTAVTAVAFLCFPFIAVFIVLAREIVLVLLGPEWLEAIVPLQILALGTLFRTTYKIDHSLANALGYVYQRSVREGIYFAAVVVGALTGVILWGLSGVALGVLVALFLNYVMAISMSLRLLNSSWREFFWTQLPGVAVGLIVGAVAVIAKYLLADGQLASLIILLITGTVSGVVIMGFLLLWPQVLGLYGLIAVNRLLRAIPMKATSNAPVRQMIERFSVAEARAVGRLT